MSDAERERFERWAESEYFVLASITNGYASSFTNAVWTAWQACAALDAVPEAVREAGAMLSNCAFNLAQCDRLNHRERQSMDESWKAWDLAIAAATSPTAGGEKV